MKKENQSVINPEEHKIVDAERVSQEDVEVVSSDEPLSVNKQKQKSNSKSFIWIVLAIILIINAVWTGSLFLYTKPAIINQCMADIREEEKDKDATIEKYRTDLANISEKLAGIQEEVNGNIEKYKELETLLKKYAPPVKDKE